MKELLFGILAYLPSYFADVGRSFLAPRRFALDAAAGGKASLQNAIVFSGISIVLVSLLPTPFMGRTDVWDKLSLIGSYCVISAGLIGALCYMVWWLLGIREKEVEFFTIFLFQCFTFFVIGEALDLAAKGLAASIDPVFYHAWQLTVAQGTALPSGSLKNAGFRSYLAVEGIGLVFALVWQVIAWGAFRHLFGVTRLRSTAALLLTLALCAPTLLVMGLVLKGLSTR